MKKVLFLINLLLIGTVLFSQVFNNEWIDYSKTYYKFKVGSNGFHRINKAALATAGLQNTDITHFQLWRNGKEVALYTTNKTGVLDDAGYIEFWGEMLDGSFDTQLYEKPEHQPNPRHSLFTDSAAYFLTVNPSGNNLRFEDEVNDIANNTLPAEPYFMHTVGQFNRGGLNRGFAVASSSYLYLSSFSEGEGFQVAALNGNGVRNINLSTSRVYKSAAAPIAQYKISVSGAAPVNRTLGVVFAGDTIAREPLNWFGSKIIEGQITNDKLDANTLRFSIVNNSQESGTPYRMSFSSLELTYPRMFHFNSTNIFQFKLAATTQGMFLDITNFTTGGVAPVLYDLTNNKRYNAFLNGARTQIVLEPSVTEREVILVSQAVERNLVGGLEERKFIDYATSSNQGDYLMITNSKLLTNSDNAIELYRQYRNSSEGGSYDAKIYDIEQLVDQYAFGIKMHPLSIKTFIKHAVAKFNNPVKNVFLIGKGVSYTRYRMNEANPLLQQLFLLPTYGDPGGDNLFALDYGSRKMAVPVGRLSVISNQEVEMYLNKVKEYEAVSKQSSPSLQNSWMKNVVHVTGTSSETEDVLLTGYLNGHARIIKDTFFGGRLESFNKHSSVEVGGIESQRLGELFEEGISVLSYLGHSSSTVLAYNLERPEQYNNKGKYPLMVVMGCNAGDFFTLSDTRLSLRETISENYVLTPEKGSIAFLASTGLGLPSSLNRYNSLFYTAVSKELYGKTIGEQMQYAINEDIALDVGFYTKMQVEQFTVHGDPAIKLPHFDKPDLVIEEAMLKVEPTNISISRAHFDLSVVYSNTGRAVNDSFNIEIKRRLPNNQEVVIAKIRKKVPAYSDTLIIRVPINAETDKGINRISVVVDSDGEIDELYETNNSVFRTFNIYAEELVPVYPYQYAIVNSPNFKLSLSTANNFSEKRKYVVEIDTIQGFSSSLKKIFEKETTGGLIEIEHGLSLIDSSVYFWRGGMIEGADTIWNISSFQYIRNGELGASQARNAQVFNGANVTNIEYTHNGLKFKEKEDFYTIKTGLYPFTQQDAHLEFRKNDELLAGRYLLPIAANTNTLRFYVLTPAGKILENKVVGDTIGSFGSFLPNTNEGLSNFFQFSVTSAEARNRIKNFLLNIDEGSFVFLTNGVIWNSSFAPDWRNDQNVNVDGESLYKTLKDAGFARIDELDKPLPFVFGFQKSGGVIIEQIGVTAGDVMSAFFSLNSTESAGSIISDRIGVVKSDMKNFYWDGYFIDNKPNDAFHIQVLGEKDNSQVDTLKTVYNPKGFIDISDIRAEEYPYLRFRLYSQDTLNSKPYQLRYWMATYNPAPEGAIMANENLILKDTVMAGEKVNFVMSFKNVSHTNFDSLALRVAITDRNNVSHVIEERKRKPLVVGDTLQVSYDLNTAAYTGANTLAVSFNPERIQPEQYMPNNMAVYNFYVPSDTLNPVMDVTFDGIRIINKDLVSAKPSILVKLTDEVKHLRLIDTSMFSVKVKFPDQSVRSYYFNGNDTLIFTPSGSGNNNDETASINFTPNFLIDGEYELIIAAKDQSGNRVGAVDYRVAFQVINKAMISNMLNYPNPFTTSTAFVFTLTGSEVPQNIRIQILTVSGKIVREVTKDELGPLHIGQNITEFKWDGTDMYGQKLGNGVYLYRVITNHQGKSLEKYTNANENTDKYFNKGYGKMYLMR